MSVPAEARSSVTDQQQQPVFDRQAELERPLEEERQQPGSFADGEEPQVRTREKLERPLAAEREVRTKRQDPGAAKTSPGEQTGSADAAQPVFDEQAALKQQLAEVQAKLDRQRQQTNERNRRWRKNNPERVRELNKIHKRTYRARKRQQDS